MQAFHVAAWWQNMASRRLKKKIISDSLSDEELWHASLVFMSFQTGKSEASYSLEQ